MLHGASDEGLAASAVEQCVSVSGVLRQGASDEGLDASRAAEQCVSVLDLLHEGASDKGLDRAAEQCVSVVDVLREGASDEGLDGRRAAEQCVSVSDALQSAAEQCESDALHEGLPLMRMPRGRRRWADSDDEEYDCFGSPRSSAAECSQDALHGEQCASGVLRAEGASGEGQGGSAAEPYVPASAAEAHERIRAMESLLDSARGRDQDECAQLYIQSVMMLLTGSADYDVQVAACRGGYQGVVHLPADYSFAGPVSGDAASARRSALWVAYRGLRDHFVAARQRVIEREGDSCLAM